MNPTNTAPVRTGRTHSTRSLLAIAALLLLMIAGAASAAVLFSDNFNTNFTNDRYINQSINWIVVAQDVNDVNGGVSYYYSTATGWYGTDYKEVTGYIIPTVFDWATYTNNNTLRDRAISMADWEVSIQAASGSWDGYVFDTGQVLFGMVRAYNETGNSSYLNASIKAANWLVATQNINGSWSNDFRPHATYHVRAAWGLLKVWELTGNSSYLNASINNTEYALTQETANHWYNREGTFPADDSAPLTHTIAYTAEGLLGIGLILNNQTYINASRNLSDVLMSKQKANGGLTAGKYNSDWSVYSSANVLTGNAQISRVWLDLYNHTNNLSYLSAAQRMNTYLINELGSSTSNSLDGGVWGSIPSNDGNYATNQLLSWATKFQIDALYRELILTNTSKNVIDHSKWYKSSLAPEYGVLNNSLFVNSTIANPVLRARFVNGTNVTLTNGTISYTVSSNGGNNEISTFFRGGTNELSDGYYLFPSTFSSLNKWRLYKKKLGVASQLGGNFGTFTANTLYNITIDVNGSYINITVNNGTLVYLNTTDTDFASGNVGIFLWGTANAIIDNFSITETTEGEPTGAIPPDPVNLANTTGNFWVNYTWAAGAGNITNSYNASQNGTWTNGSANLYFNATVGAHNWSNITVWAYNSSGNGNLSTGSVSQNTQIPNNVITISNIQDTYSLTEGQTLNIDANYADADGDTGTFADNATQWNVNTTTGIVSWVTVDGDQGTYNWLINVSDGYGSVATKTFTVTVGDSTPGTPADLTPSTSNFWVNYTWSVGANTDSFNVSYNGTWTNGSAATAIQGEVGAHGWGNISVAGYNATLGALSSAVTANTQVPNNAPVMNAIGNKNADENTWLNFTVSGSDADSDSLTCSTNASKGTLTGCNFNWSITYDDAGTYNWIYYLNDSYSGSDSETITVTVSNIVNGTANITAWYNTINGWNQTAMSINAGNSATFNVTVNQTINNVSWKVGGSEEQNTSSLQFTRAFSTVGEFNVTAQAFNANGSSNIVYTVVTVTESGGGGTNWDWLDGYVKDSEGAAVNGATVTTSEGSDVTDSSGYYSFGYVFVDGNTYWVNVTMAGYNANNTQVTFTLDHQVHNATLTLTPAVMAPNITSWGNSNTSNSNLTFTVAKNTNITFNITANQTVTTTWTGTASPTKINGTNATDSYAFKNFTSTGTFTVIASCSNDNGSCTNGKTWTVTVTGVGGITVEGYVQNVLELKLQNARVDLGSSFKFTDANGYYSVENVDEGSYTVLARQIGYRNASNTSTIDANTVINFTLQERTSGTVSAPGFNIPGAVFILAILWYVRRSRG